MLAHAILLRISMHATLFYLRTENVCYAAIKRPTKRPVSTLHLHGTGSALCLIVLVRNRLAHEYMKNEHRQAREADNVNYELA